MDITHEYFKNSSKGRFEAKKCFSRETIVSVQFVIFIIKSRNLF